MNASGSLRCVFAKPTTSARSCPKRDLHFHITRSVRPHRGPKYNPATSLLGPAILRHETPDQTSANKPVHRHEKASAKRKKGGRQASKPYTEEETARLKQIYNPEQFAALQAGEEAVSQEDISEQGVLRSDPWAFDYIEDFSKIHPVIDHPVRVPEGQNYDPKLRFKTEEEIDEDLANWVDELPDDPTRLDYIKFQDNLRLTVGKEEAERNPRTALAPEIPKGIPALQRGRSKTDDDIDPAYKRLMKQTGFSLQQIRRFRVKNLVAHRVVNQTRLGKIQSIYYLTIAGNGRGLLGIGEGKSTEPEDGRRQALFNAIRSLQPVPRYEDRTIYGDVRVKFGAVEVELMTRPPGRPLLDS